MANFTDADVQKLKQLINEGIQVKSEMEALKGGLSDTVKAIAEELDVKPAVLNKAINIAYKAEFTKAKDDFDELENILETVGRTL
jgi:predicted regulator of amino acid metabolism with ACT domain